MASRALLLATLLVSRLALADGPRVVLEVERGSILTTEGREVAVRGGAYLDNDTLIATAKELATLKAENKTLREAPVATPALVIVACVLGIALGAGVVFVAQK